MSNEKQYNSWIDRLDQLEQLPGATLAKDAAWDKLYDRLKEKPRRRRMAWYIPAAACLLLACFVAWMMTGSKKQQRDVVVQPPVKKENTITKQSQSPVVENKQEQIVIVQPSKTKTTREDKPVVKKPETLVYSVPVNDEPKQDVIAVLQPLVKDTVMTMVTAAAPKKKMKMVHLNEIGQPAPDEIRMAKSNWKVMFNRPDDFARPTYQNNSTTEKGVLTIKVTPQN